MAVIEVTPNNMGGLDAASSQSRGQSEAESTVMIEDLRQVSHCIGKTAIGISHSLLSNTPKSRYISRIITILLIL
jgi:hypothetical protein